MTTNTDPLATNWERYRNNPIRHLGDIAAHTEKRVMNSLTEAGYPQLAMQYSAPLNLLYQQPLRLTELAELLNMSKQLCLQSLQPIKKAGYIKQFADDNDRRAKLICLSEQGKTLITDAARKLLEINHQFSVLLGETAFNDTSAQLAKISRTLEINALKHLPNEHIDQITSAIMGMLSRHIHNSLATKLARNGHLQLQLSYAQVLLYVGLDGTSISTMAECNGVTIQAISRVVKELEQRGYVTRKTSQLDKRSRRVFFTAQGLGLINDSVNVMNELEQDIVATIGSRAFARLAKHLAQLHQALELNTYTVSPYQAELASTLLCTTHSPNKEPTMSKKALLKHFSATLSGASGDKNIEEWIDSRLSPNESRKLKALIQKLHIT